MLLGIVLIFFGIGSLAFSQTSPFYVIVGIGLIVLGVRCMTKKTVEPPRNRNHGDSYGGSDCVTVHTGSDVPEGAYLADGRYESFSGTGWSRDAFGRPYNFITGVSVEKDPFGTDRFSDDDSYGSIRESAEYGRYNMYYGD